ncbi:hypothetical protein RSP816_05945 [Ralstonia solanacearum]|nr:hypothetical protein RSP597_06705 [Ralstonia solanacearum]RCW13448.1 hypothetical protein RSP816_05945 [Ralstonia solanacearum]
MVERGRGGVFPMSARVVALGTVAVAPALPGVIEHEVSSTFMPDVRFIAIDGLLLADGPPVVPALAGMRMAGGVADIEGAGGLGGHKARGAEIAVRVRCRYQRTAEGHHKVADWGAERDGILPRRIDVRAIADNRIGVS